MKNPSYDLVECKLSSVKHLFELYHAYKGVGRLATYVFAVIEKDLPVAAYVWNPPAPNAAKSVCKDYPHAVLSLSRMAAVPRSERELKHISKPLRRQMKFMIDRDRWPVLTTYSDEGLGHNGFVYQCSGWTKTTRKKAYQYTKNGVRASPYSAGLKREGELKAAGSAYIQRWEHWACEPAKIPQRMADSGWYREPIPGRKWKSGNQAYRWVKKAPQQLTLGV